MEWINQLQRDLGGPVVAFMLEHWILLAAAATALGFWWLFGRRLGDDGPEQEGFLLGGSDRDGGMSDGGDD